MEFASKYNNKRNETSPQMAENYEKLAMHLLQSGISLLKTTVSETLSPKILGISETFLASLEFL